MTELRRPEVGLQASFLAAMDEFVEEARAGDDSVLGGDLATWGSTWQEPDVFARYVAGLLAEETVPSRPGFVTASTWWGVADGEYVGRISLRHELTDHLREVGGHVGYDVRRSARRRGHATAMLTAVRGLADERGIERLLLTCDDDNVGSRTVIETCGGVLEDQRGLKLRYWVPTTDAGLS